uniref:Uncharacterized protein n=1 Tax=viral metagenome TaxID=1070528 RepID=A0A6M3LQM8_9ZZZZ
MKPKVNDKGETKVTMSVTDRQKLAAAAGILKELSFFAHGSVKFDDLEAACDRVTELVRVETHTFTPL